MQLNPTLKQQCLDQISLVLNEPKDIVSKKYKGVHFVFIEEDGVLVLYANSNSQKQMLFTQHSSLESALLPISHDIKNIRIELGTQTPTKQKKISSTQLRDQNLILKLDNHQTFDSFFVYPTISPCVASAKMAAKNPGDKTNNPLYIYGSPGSGKTHLLNAIGHLFQEENQDKTVLYTRSELFIKAFVASIYSGRTKPENSDFSKQISKADIFLLDDIQALATAEMSRKEIFNLVCSFLQTHTDKQIVFAGDRYPSHINNMEGRLASRLEGGRCFSMQPPTYEVLIKIIQSHLAPPHAQKDYTSITDETVIEAIAEHRTDDVRRLIGTVRTVVGHFEINPPSSGRIDLNFFHQVTPQEVFKEAPKPTIDAIILATANHFQVSREDILSTKRTADITLARHVAIYISHKKTQASHYKIATSFKRKDHTAAIHAVKKIEKKKKDDLSLKTDIQSILSNLKR